MNRREMLTGLAVVGVALPAAAQVNTDCSGVQFGMNLPCKPPARDKAEEERQYAICKQRGHVPTVWGSQHYMGFTTTGVTTTGYVITPDAPADLYEAETATEWETCWQCKKRYRYVTKIEEQD